MQQATIQAPANTRQHNRQGGPGNRLPDYCLAKDLTASATFRDTAGSREEFTRMISKATRDNSPLDFIAVWKLNGFSMSLEETIELLDKLRGVASITMTVCGKAD